MPRNDNARAWKNPSLRSSFFQDLFQLADQVIEFGLRGLVPPCLSEPFPGATQAHPGRSERDPEPCGDGRAIVTRAGQQERILFGGGKASVQGEGGGGHGSTKSHTFGYRSRSVPALYTGLPGELR